jgi:hypothetical protein
MSSKLLDILVIKDMPLGNHLNDICHFFVTLDMTFVTHVNYELGHLCHIGQLHVS